jgi:hypothetical protein
MNVTGAYLDELLPKLSERDLAIIELVGRFKLANGGQIERLFFGHCSERSRTRNRQAVLRRLVDWRVLAVVGTRRVGGERGGSTTAVFALDVAGQHVAALTSSRPRRPYNHYEPTMGHALAVTELYVQLVEAERGGRLTLLIFEAEPYCWRTFGSQTLKPDAFVQIGLTTNGNRRKGSFFIEVDRADQWGAKLRSKVPQYQAYREYERPSGQVFPRVQFLTVHARRVVYLKKLVRGHAGFGVGLFSDAIALLTGGEAPSKADAEPSPRREVS